MLKLVRKRSLLIALCLLMIFLQVGCGRLSDSGGVGVDDLFINANDKYCDYYNTEYLAAASVEEYSKKTDKEWMLMALRCGARGYFVNDVGDDSPKIYDAIAVSVWDTLSKKTMFMVGAVVLISDYIKFGDDFEGLLNTLKLEYMPVIVEEVKPHNVEHWEIVDRHVQQRIAKGENPKIREDWKAKE